MKKFIQLNTLLLLCIACAKGGSNDQPTPPLDSTLVVTPLIKTAIFSKGADGYSCFRIPAIIATKKGTLLAFAEGRKNNCTDEGDIDLVLKRSTDNGKTWSSLIKVWDDGDNTCGNPVPVVDQQTGDIVLAMSWNLGTDKIGTINNGTSKDTRRAYVTRSSNDGLTWAPATEITTSVKDPSWGWYATGPCHGIQVTQGAHKGRLVIPCTYIEVGENRKGYSLTSYSDDGGHTWHRGAATPPSYLQPNESTVAELTDGNLMLNMRCNIKSRVVSVSNDAGNTWSDVQPDYTLPEPICQGSLLSYNGHLFFSNPASTTRDHMSIRMSTDNGKTWTKKYLVNEGKAAYSDLVMWTDKQIGIFYETGIANPYEEIRFEVYPTTAIFK
jgi:sialidase-1